MYVELGSCSLQMEQSAADALHHREPHQRGCELHFLKRPSMSSRVYAAGCASSPCVTCLLALWMPSLAVRQLASHTLFCGAV